MTACRSRALLLAALIADGAFAAGYTALDVTPADTSDCRPWGLNASGQVVGSTVLAESGQTRGFVTGPAGAGARLIGTLGGSSSTLGKINDRGQAVGQAALPGDNDAQAILVEAGATAPTPIGALGQSGVAYALNKKGRVVGSMFDPSDRFYHAYITSGRQYEPRLGGAWQVPAAVLADGTVAGTVDLGTAWRPYITGPDASGMTLLDTLGGMITLAYAMNKDRVVVGFATNADNSWRHAFVTDPGGSGLRDLGLPARYSAAHDINKHGKIVGYLNLEGTGNTAFVANRDGSWKILDSLVTLPGGASLTVGEGINDLGQIVAQSSDQRCYLLTPTP